MIMKNNAIYLAKVLLDEEVKSFSPDIEERFALALEIVLSRTLLRLDDDDKIPLEIKESLKKPVSDDSKEVIEKMHTMIPDFSEVFKQEVESYRGQTK